MKRVALSIILLVVFCTSGRASTVTPEVSRRAAVSFWNTHRPTEVKSVSAEQLHLVAVEGLPMLHIWAVGEDGFVIMAASDRVAPVLAYSFDSPAGREPNPEVMFWLRRYNAQVEYAERDAENPQANAQWAGLLTSTVPPEPVSIVNVPRLMETRWDQGVPYNNYCPYDSTYHTNAVVGCVATAMAQIMKYWNHPSSGEGYHSYEHQAWGGSTSYGLLSADFAGTTYLWDYMPNILDQYFPNERGTHAVATLSYHCGVAVDMMYGTSATGGSGAYSNCGYWANTCAESAFKDNFKYSQDLHHMQRNTSVHRDSLAYDSISGTYSTVNYYVDSALISDSLWCDMVDSSLAHGIPMYYSGSDNSGGHAFVLDGADLEGRYHFNWGWSGSYDGFYSINDIAPRHGGIGGNTTYSFNSSQAAIFGIVPIPETFDSAEIDDTVCNNVSKYWFHEYEFPAADTVYSAVWLGTVYTINLHVIPSRRLYVNPNGGVGYNYDMQFCPNEGIDAPGCAYTRDGYNFIGWAFKRTGYDTLYQPGDHLALRTSKTIYAIWQDTTQANVPDDTVGISIVDGGNIVVSPNPTRESITLSLDGSEDFCVNVTDAWGRVLIQRKNVRGDVKLSLASLPAGTYFVAVCTSGAVYKQRIIKL